MSEHSPEHEALVAAIVVGDLSPDAAEARALLEGCETCRQELAELQGLGVVVDEAGELERHVLAALPELDDAPGASDVARIIHAEAHKVRAAFHRRRWMVMVSGVALLVVAVALLRHFLEEPAPLPEIPLGDAIVALEPVGAGSFDMFRWRCDEGLPATGFFRVTIYDAALEVVDLELPGAEFLARSDRLREPVWRPSEEEHGRWPDAIYWRVEAFGDRQTFLHSSKLQRASRSP